MKLYYKTTLRALTFVTLLLTLLPSALRAQEKEWFTVVLFGDPELGMGGDDRPNNHCTTTAITKWFNGIINMGKDGGLQFTFENAPAGYVPQADLVICMGDMDGDSKTSNSDLETAFNLFNNKIPFITMLGNHDKVPDYWNGGDLGPTYTNVFGIKGGGAVADAYAIGLSKTYRNKAKNMSNGITDVTEYTQGSGDMKVTPFAFTFKGVRFFICQTYWFQKSYTRKSATANSTPPTHYAPNEVLAQLTTDVASYANTPSVWVQHYPLNCADRWWNDTNANGQSISPSNTATYSTVAEKKDKYKDLITSTKNPVHFSGHDHYMHTADYTANGKTFTDYTAPYFADCGGAFIALCNNVDGVVEVQMVNFDADAQAYNTVNSLEGLSNNKAYTIRTDGKGNLRHEGTNTYVTCPTTGYDGTDAHQQWAILTLNGHQYLYNIGAGKFASKNGEDLDLVDEPGDAARVTIEYLNNKMGYPWTIKFAGQYVNCNTGVDKGYQVNNWSTLDAGNQFAFVEVDDFTGFDNLATGALSSDLVAEATRVLATRGVGYPKTTSAEYIALNNAINAYNTAVSAGGELTYSLTHTWNTADLTDGTRIALQCRDTNGGAGYYLNGATTKSSTFSKAANVYVLEAATSGTGFYLKRESDGQYIAHGGGFANHTVITQSTNSSDATAFTIVRENPTGWTTQQTGTDQTKTLRFKAVGQTMYLNTNDKNSTPKYCSGTGGYSIWYVHLYTEQMTGTVDASIYRDINTALTNYYNCTDVEQPANGRYYRVTPTDGSAATSYLAQTNADNTFRLVGPEAKFSDGSGYTDSYSAEDNNLTLSKAGNGAAQFGCVTIGGTTPAARWTEISAPSAINPVYEGAPNRKIQMTLPGINTEHVAVYVGDNKQTVTVTPGTNTTVLLPGVANGTVFTIYVGDGSIVRKITYTRPNTYYVTVHHRLYGSGVSVDDLATVIEEVEASAARTWQPQRLTLPAGYDIYGGEWPQWDIIENDITSLEIFYTYDETRLPFAFSTQDTDGNLTAAHYYTMTMHGKNAFFQANSSGGDATNQIKLTTDARTRDVNDYFYFVGNNSDGFTVHNTAVSPVLSYDINNRKFSLAENKYVLLDTYDGTTHKYAIRVATSKALMNEDYGNTNNVGIWSGSPDPTHVNALVTFTAADNATVEAAIAAVPWPESGTYYYIKSGNTHFTTPKAVTVNESNVPRWDTFAGSDYNFVWQVNSTGGGKYELLNVNNNRYLKKVGETSTESANAYLIYIGENRFAILTSEEHAMHAGGHAGGSGVSGAIISYYGSGNDPSSWMFEEVSDEGMLECIGLRNTLKTMVVSAETALATDEYTNSTNLITAASQLASNAGYNELGGGTDGGGIPALVDGNTNTFFHSSYSGDSNKTTANPKHLLQIDFLEPRQCVQLKWWKRFNGTNNNRPSVVEVWGTNTASLAALAEGKNYTTVDYNQSNWNDGWTRLTTLNIDNSNDSVVVNAVDLQGNQYVRLNVMSTSTNTNFFTMSEIKAYVQDAELARAISEANTLISSNSNVRSEYEQEIADLKTILGRPMRISLAALIAEIENKAVGAKLGEYTVSASDYDTQMASAKALVADETSDVDDLLDATETLSGWSFTLNTPQQGQFIRFQGVTEKWITAEAKTIGSLNQMAMGTDKTNANTIFYVAESGTGTAKLVSYGKGVYVVPTFGLGAVGADGYEFAFGDSKVEDGYGNYGQYSIRVTASNGSRTAYLYDSGNNNSKVSTDRNGNAEAHTVWTIEEVDALPVTITSAGYASFYTPVTVTVPNGVSAYVAEDKGTYLLLTEVSTISAGQGVILKGESNTYNFTIAGSDNGETSALNGDVASTISRSGDYVLSMGTINGVAHKVGFFPARDSEVLKGFKSYLHSGATNVRAFSFSFDEIATAIDAAGNDGLQDGVMYNLRGQRVQKANGIVIINGKKVMVK